MQIFWKSMTRPGAIPGTLIAAMAMLAVGGCGDSPPTTEQQKNVAASDETATAGPASMASDKAAPVPAITRSATTANIIRSCRAEIGEQFAARMVETCRAVSPATHPPCNAANSCAMIDDEIARGCAMLPDSGADVPGCRPFQKDLARADNLIRRYYRAIDARDYATAYSQWSDDGAASGKDYASFAAGFAETASVDVRLGYGQPPEGAAGSLYITIPVTVNAVLRDGRRQSFTGSYTLRRVNDVDGSTAEQRSWHIASAQLRRAITR